MSRVRHPNPRTFGDLKLLRSRSRSNIQVIAQQIVPVQAFINLHRPAEQPGPICPPLDILDRFNGTKQNSRCMAFSLSHDIHAEVHPVNHINVRMTRRAEHYFSAFGEALGRMRGQVVLAEIRLDFDDPANSLMARGGMHQPFAQQLPRYEDRIPVVKRARQLLHFSLLRG